MSIAIDGVAQHVERGDQWYFGFAQALVSVWRLHHEGTMVRHIMNSNGITLKHLEAAGVESRDLDAICAALGGKW